MPGGPWDQRVRFRELKHRSLRTARAWALKETLLGLWNYTYEGAARSFFRRWFEGHRTLTLEVHPLWNYVRNRVVRPIGDARRRDGIVEEHFRKTDDLLRPDRMFGGPLRMLPNMLRVGYDIWGFLDLPAMRNYLVEELWLRS